MAHPEHAHTAQADELLAQMGWVQKLARRLVRDPHTADDVAQATWLLATERPPTRVSGGAGLRAWLAAVTRTLARQSVRTERRRHDREHRASAPAEPSDPSEVVARGALHQRVGELVMGMEEPTRSTLLYSYFDGLSSREVAARMQVSAETVRQRLSRGVRRLSEALQSDRRDWSMALVTLAWPSGLPLSLLVPACLKALGGFIMAKRVAVGITMFLLSVGVGWPILQARSSDNAALEVRQPEQVAEAPGNTSKTKTPAEEVRSDVRAAPHVAVIDSESQPVAKARVAFIREGTVMAPQTTRQDGSVPLPAGADRAVVAAPGYTPQVFDLTSDSTGTPKQLRLGGGAAVAGELFIDGKVAKPGTELRLSIDSSVPAKAGLQGELLKDLKKASIEFDKIGITVRAQGRFELRGLESTFLGKLGFPEGLALVQSSEGTYPEFGELVLMAPNDGLRIHVVRLPWIRGRAVWKSDGSPAAGVILWVVGHFEDRRSSDAVGVMTDSKGRFATPLRAYIHGRDPASLRLHSAGIARWTRFAFGSIGRKYELIPASKMSGAGDVGDIAFEDSDLTRVLVVGPGGKPLIGARVNHTREGKVQSSRSQGSKGITLRDLPRGEVELTAQADGHQTKMVRIHIGEPKQQHRITLERSARLRFLVECHPSAVQTGMRLEVEADSDLFVPQKAGGQPSGAMKQTFLVDNGGIGLTDAVPGLRVRLTLLDFLGQVITRKAATTPARGEWLDCHIPLPAAHPKIDGIVVDTRGNPIPGAMVTLYDKLGSLGTVAKTDTEGRFAFPIKLPGGHFGLSVQHAAFGTINESVGEERSFRVELTRGRDVLVHVEDDSGRAMPQSRARCSVGSDHGGIVMRVGPATFLCRNVPRGEGEAEARIFGATYSTPIDNTTKEVTIRVPLHGTLQLEIDPALKVPEGTRLVLRGKHKTGAGRFAQPLSRGFNEWMVPSMPLLPGTWTLQLERQGPGRLDRTPLGEPLEAQIRGNGITRQRLRRP